MYYSQYGAIQNMSAFSFIIEHLPQKERIFSIPPPPENRVYNDNGDINNIYKMQIGRFRRIYTK